MQCCVPFCVNTSDNASTSEGTGITFQKLPSKENLRAAWLKALGIQDHHLPDPAVVCSQHFIDEDFYTTKSCRRQIRSDAIPSTVQMCMICLDSDSKLFLMSKHKLEEAYQQLTGLSLFQLCARTNLQDAVCVLCAQRLRNFRRLRDLSLRARSVVMDSIQKYELITMQNMKMMRQTTKQLKPNFVSTTLGPDNCDLYIDHTYEDRQTKSQENIGKNIATKGVKPQEKISKNIATEEMRSLQNTFITCHNNEEQTKLQENIIENNARKEVKSQENIAKNFITCHNNEEQTKLQENIIENNARKEVKSQENIAKNFITCHNNEEQTKSQENIVTKNVKSQENIAKNFVTHVDQQAKYYTQDITVKNIATNEDSWDSVWIVQNIEVINEDNNQTDNLNIENLPNEYADSSISVKIEPMDDSNDIQRNESSSSSADGRPLLDNSVLYRPKTTVSSRQHPASNPLDILTPSSQGSTNTVLSGEGSHQHLRTPMSIGSSLPLQLCDSLHSKEDDNFSDHLVSSEANKVTVKVKSLVTICDSVRNTEVKQKTNAQNTIKCANFKCPHCFEEFERGKAYFEHVSTHVQTDRAAGYDLTQMSELHGTENWESVTFTNKKELNTDSSSSDCEDNLGVPLSEIRARAIQKRKTTNEMKIQEVNENPHMSTDTGEDPYTCKICNLKCAFKSYYTRHMRSHTGEKPYACEVCDYKCAVKSTLARHKQTHTGVKPHICKICDYQCARKSHLLLHMRTHTGEKPFSCEICGCKYTQKGSLISHMRIHTGEKPYSCDSCDYKCVQQSTLENHKRTHTGEKPFACGICTYRSSNRSDLTKHIRAHQHCKEGLKSKPRPDLRTNKSPKFLRNSCFIIEEETKSQENMAKSFVKHTNEDQKTKSQENIATNEESWDYVWIVQKTEEINEHNNQTDLNIENFVLNSNEYADSSISVKIEPMDDSDDIQKNASSSSSVNGCPQLDNSLLYKLPSTTVSSQLGTKNWDSGIFTNKEEILELNTDSLSSDREDKLGVPLSEIRAQAIQESKTTMKIEEVNENTHMSTDTGENPNTCKICNLKCAFKSYLTRHMRSHTGEKPYACEVCDYKSAMKSTLDRHRQTHTGVKPHFCKICDYQCARKSHLLLHMRTHTGEKPFSCEICGCKTTQKGSLITHMRIHTGEKPYSCDSCDFKCVRQSSLDNHKRTHTGEKPFACGTCTYRSGNRGDLTNHKRIHTGEKPYACGICTYRSAIRGDLTKHIRAHQHYKPKKKV
ncbi:zinc finger protein 91 [Bicyclus anynana]|uniref:Zinc finger protein 91 n=1 Tax=Bicyclus anynana TaxID=110368 RepID=A0A6J1NXG0_BICAN|nr:zinc finger protein 91 [Bicyclus anynana]